MRKTYFVTSRGAAARLLLTILAAIACLVIGLLLTRGSMPQHSPSVVLLVIDTLRADKLGIYGSSAPASKELDAVAQRGVVFERAISQASWTRASMASMLTGLYPSKAGVVKERWDRLPLEATTLAEVFAQHGYDTIGLTANPQLNRDFQFEQGFATYIESTVLFQWMKDSKGKEKMRRDKSVRTAPEMVAETTRLVNARRSTAPLYLQMLLMDVHAHHKIKDEEVDADLRGFPDAHYLQAVRNATAPLAQFIEELDRLLKGNVLFVVTADHGEGLNDHPSVARSNKHGNLLYRSHIHVPWLVIPGSSLGSIKPKRIPDLVPLVDLMPTLLDCSGVKVPESLDGTSICSSIRSSTAPAQQRFVLSQTQWRPDVNKHAITDGNWLLIMSSDGWKGTSPTELQPLMGIQDGTSTSRHEHEKATVSQLREALDDLLAQQ